MTLIEYLRLAEQVMDSGELPEMEQVELFEGGGVQYMGHAKAEKSGNPHAPVEVKLFYDSMMYYIELRRVTHVDCVQYKWQLDIDWDREPGFADRCIASLLACEPYKVFI